jgi:NDP-sugar pyrophosphorylase family protein
MIRAVIQAGGQGMRLQAYTTVLPKPLLPIDETPILEIIVRQLVHYGFRDLTVTIGSLGHLIMAMLGDGSRFGARIEYLRESAPRGTFGALSGLSNLTKPILVLNGDLLTDFNYREFLEAHCAGNTDLSAAAFHKEIPLSMGVFKLDENSKAIGFYEKPVLSFPCNMGIYAVSPPLLPLIPHEGPFGFDDLMKLCLARSVSVRVQSFNGLWLDIGRAEDYANASEWFRQHRDRLLPAQTAEMLTRMPRPWTEPKQSAMPSGPVKRNPLETIVDR